MMLHKPELDDVMYESENFSPLETHHLDRFARL